MTAGRHRRPNPFAIKSVMKTAILSDIHSNATALLAVLRNIELSEVDSIISLGDNIGYGPEPEKVINILRAKGIPSVIGNHELAVIQPGFLNVFNPVARTSIEMTIDLLSEDSKRHIKTFANVIVRQDCRFVHGFPPESPTRYLFEVMEPEIKQTLKATNERLCFIGHTHELEIIELDVRTDKLIRKPLQKESLILHPDHKYLINAGSVGQPRDGNNQAKYVIWDSDAHELTIKYISYNISDTVKKIYQAGLPEQHALRLM